MRRCSFSQGPRSVELSQSISATNIDRRGFYDCGRLRTHRWSDALDEIDAWIGWLKTQGATEIALLGRRQGGAQVALYAAERNDPAVGAVVLLRSRHL